MSDLVAAGAPPRRLSAKSTARGAAVILPPLVVGIIALAGWELFVRITGVQQFLLPAPSRIWGQLVENWDQIWSAFGRTAWVSVSGFVGGVLVAATLAVLCSRFRPLAAGFTPLAAALAATPIVALAPIYFKWFGIVEPTAKQFTVATVVFFPVYVNTVRGLLQTQPVHLELMRTYGVGWWRTLREVRIPGALPMFMTSLKLAASMGVIAAIVSEYFGGQTGTLGSEITSSAASSNYARAWAVVIMAAVLGIALFAVVALAERLALSWHPSVRRKS